MTTFGNTVPSNSFGVLNEFMNLAPWFEPTKRNEEEQKQRQMCLAT